MVKLYSLAKLSNSPAEYCGPLMDLNTCGIPWWAKIDHRCVMTFLDVVVVRGPPQFSENSSALLVCTLWFSSQTGLSPQCFRGTLVVNWNQGFIMLWPMLQHSLHVWTRSCSCLCSPGHHTDCFTLAIHLVAFWWPAWSCSKIFAWRFCEMTNGFPWDRSLLCTESSSFNETTSFSVPSRWNHSGHSCSHAVVHKLAADCVFLFMLWYVLKSSLSCR